MEPDFEGYSEEQAREFYMNNKLKTKTPSTAEHGSVKGNISFESAEKNLANLGIDP